MFAQWWVSQWKLQQSLYRNYGGRVIYQQVGPEAIDAMRDFLEEAESKGRFAIYDEQLRSHFWSPYKRETPGVFVPDPKKVFEHSWSAFEPTEEANR